MESKIKSIFTVVLILVAVIFLFISCTGDALSKYKEIPGVCIRINDQTTKDIESYFKKGPELVLADSITHYEGNLTHKATGKEYSSGKGEKGENLYANPEEDHKILSDKVGSFLEVQPLDGQYSHHHQWGRGGYKHLMVEKKNVGKTSFLVFSIGQDCRHVGTFRKTDAFFAESKEKVV